MVGITISPFRITQLSCVYINVISFALQRTKRWNVSKDVNKVRRCYVSCTLFCYDRASAGAVRTIHQYLFKARLMPTAEYSIAMSRVARWMKLVYISTFRYLTDFKKEIRIGQYFFWHGITSIFVNRYKLEKNILN